MYKRLYLLTEDTIEPFCHFSISHNHSERRMSAAEAQEAGAYARRNKLIVSVVYGREGQRADIEQALSTVLHENILPLSCRTEQEHNTVYTTSISGLLEVVNGWTENVRKVIVRVHAGEIQRLYTAIDQLFPLSKRIEILLVDVDLWTDEDLNQYRLELGKLSELYHTLLVGGKKPCLSIFHDLLFRRCFSDCGAGIDHLTLAPDGLLYICPGFYYDNGSGIGPIGSLRSSVSIPDSRLLEREFSPICRICDAIHCRRCIYLNRRSTLEVNIPSEQQCIATHIEREYARILFERLEADGIRVPGEPLMKLDYEDPMVATNNYTTFAPSERSDGLKS